MALTTAGSLRPQLSAGVSKNCWGRLYQPLQSNLNPHFRHLMHPLTLARSWDSPHLGQVVVSSGSGTGVADLSAKDDSLAFEKGGGDTDQDRRADE